MVLRQKKINLKPSEQVWHLWVNKFQDGPRMIDSVGIRCVRCSGMVLILIQTLFRCRSALGPNRRL